MDVATLLGGVARPMTTQSWRDRYLSFIERHDIAWELGMAGLAVLFLAVGFAGDDVSEAARVLGVARSTVHRMTRRLGVPYGSVCEAARVLGVARSTVHRMKRRHGVP